MHLGARKTGTSTVQRFMDLNRDALEQAGLCYPRTPGKARHEKFALFLTPEKEMSRHPPWMQRGITDWSAFRHEFRAELLEEVGNSRAPQVLLSDETLFDGSESMLRRLRRFARNNARSLRLVVYLRRQDDHLVSRYQQEVKTGEIRRLADRSLLADFSDVYDYATQLDQVARVVEPDALIVRRYEPSAFDGGSLLEDFLHAADVNVDADGLTMPEVRNVSLGAEAVEFLRLLNLRRVQVEGHQAQAINNRKIVRLLAAEPQGDRLTLPTPMLDEFMAQWEPGNREVAQRWFGEEDGVLFRTPRSTEGATQTQALEPARVDHFADLLSLPQRYRQPLRLMAAQGSRR